MTDKQRHISYADGGIFAEYHFVQLEKKYQRLEEKESINQQYVLNNTGTIAPEKAQKELCQVLSERGL